MPKDAVIFPQDESAGAPSPVDPKFNLNEYGETVAFVTPTEATGGSTADRPKIPESIGRYEIRDVLGQGGFGAVYRGFDQQLNRHVAIKVPLGEMSKDIKEQFVQEARQLAQLSHSNIVTIYDVGIDEGTCYAVAEYLEGQNLNEYMRSRTVTWQEAAKITAAIADALAVAHSRGIVHRDVKPANIIMTQRGEDAVPVLVDFGLALSEWSAASRNSQRGQVAGTPNFMSPEQAQGEGHRIDGRTDIYSLGVVLYRMLSGKLPFAAPSITELLRSVISDEPRPPRQFVRGLPRDIERICLKAMAKKIADRYTTASDFAYDLRSVLRKHEERLETAVFLPLTPQAASKKEGAKILIADDHQLSRFKLQNDLQKWGHDVTVAEDGEEAWELFQRQPFSIVVTDWMMPRIDGLELVKLIRSSDSADYVYIIMLTAKAEKHDIVAGMGAGADDFLSKPFHRDELQVRLRAGIRITKLIRDLHDTNQRLEKSREAAAQIQRSFLPTNAPQVAGCEFAWEHCPSGKLGGDMFNVLPVDDRRLIIYAFDVTGEGVSASLLATSLSRALSNLSGSNSLVTERDAAGRIVTRRPGDVVKAINSQFGKLEANQFFTLLYGVLDLESREFQFVSAGSPPVLHLGADSSLTMLDIDGFPIGIDPDLDEFPQKSVSLNPKDRLLIYSDGLTDAQAADGEVFGAARLIDAVQESAGRSLASLVQTVMKELREWRGRENFDDDASLVGLKLS